jgi:hypothetical protein
MAIPPLARVALRYLGRAAGPPIDIAESDQLLGAWSTVFGPTLDPLEAQLGGYPGVPVSAYALAILRLSRERFGNSYQAPANLRFIRTQFLTAAGEFPAGPAVALVAPAAVGMAAALAPAPEAAAGAPPADPTVTAEILALLGSGWPGAGG